MFHRDVDLGILFPLICFTKITYHSLMTKNRNMRSSEWRAFIFVFFLLTRMKVQKPNPRAIQAICY